MTPRTTESGLVVGDSGALAAASAAAGDARHPTAQSEPADRRAAGRSVARTGPWAALDPPSRRLLSVALIGVAVMILADAWLNYHEALPVGALRRLFNTAREDSLPSFLGLVQSVLMAATAWGIWWLRHTPTTGSSSAPEATSSTRGWFWVAVLLSYLAIDDGAQVHERLGTAAEELAGANSWLGSALGVFPSYAWQVVVAPVLALAVAAMLVFLWRQVPERRFWLALVPLLFAVALGLDFLEGLPEASPWNPYVWASQRFDLDAFTLEFFYATGLQSLQHFSRSIEEMIELLANTLLWIPLIGAARSASGSTRRPSAGSRRQAGAAPPPRSGSVRSS